MNKSRAQALIQQWTAQKSIPSHKAAEALAVADVTPAASSWHGFLDKLLLANGGGLFLFGVIFFFAFNWQAITRFHKFAMIEGLVVASLWAYGHWQQKASGKMWLLAASVFVGVLLAFYGQTYQTGADTWQLFATWAALITPWALLAQLAALWFIWLLLLNLSLFLYFHAFHGFFGLIFSGGSIHLALFCFNSLALLAWELAARHLAWLQGRREVRLLAVMSGFSISWLMLSFIFNDSADSNGFMLLVYPAWLAAMYWVYRYLIIDVFMLAGLCLSVIVVSTAFWGDSLLKANDGLGFFALAFWVIILSSAAIKWLKQVVAQEPHHD